VDETDWTAEGPKISSEEALEAVRVLVAFGAHRIAVLGKEKKVSGIIGCP